MDSGVCSLLGLEEVGPRQGRPSSQGTAEFCAPGNVCHKYDYCSELAGRANVNRNFMPDFSNGFVNFRDNLSALLFSAWIGI